MDLIPSLSLSFHICMREAFEEALLLPSIVEAKTLLHNLLTEVSEKLQNTRQPNMREYNWLPVMVNKILNEKPCLSIVLAPLLVQVVGNICKVFVKRYKEVEEVKAWQWGTRTIAKCIDLDTPFSAQDSLLSDLGITFQQRQMALLQERAITVHHLCNSSSFSSRIDPVATTDLKDNFYSLATNIFGISNNTKELQHILQFLLDILRQVNLPRQHLFEGLISYNIYPDNCSDRILAEMWQESLPLFHDYVCIRM